MARRKPEDIIALVEGHYEATEPLRTRMEDDHAIYRLEPFDAGEGYQSYTSNEPKTFANKIMEWVSGAEMTVRIPHNGLDVDLRDKNDQKEKFLIGILRAADDRLCNLLMPSIRDQLAWYTAIRGWYAGSSLLVKRSDGTPYADITPWDPLHTYWGMGEDGLDWACYKTIKTKDQIFAQYNVKIDWDSPQSAEGSYVYDFYDKEMNIIIVHNGDMNRPNFRVVKKQMKHGAGKVPVFIGSVGANPLIIGLNNTQIRDTIADVGESVYSATRDLYPKHNLMMSILLELANRSRRQGILVRSRDGTKTLDEDPYLEGSEISLAQGENVEPLGMLEIAKETGSFMGLVSGELQRGSLPHSVHGELNFQLSGYAINTLRQGVETLLGKYLRAIEKAYKMIFEIIADQYSSGSFEAMELSGMGRNRTYFLQTITPDVIKGAGAPVINLVGQLPQDDMSKVSMAQMLRDGPVPLMSDRAIRDGVLAIQDSDEMDDAIKEQQAERMLPEATLFTLMQAAERQGREDLVDFYMGELLSLLLEKQRVMQERTAALQPQPPMGGPPGGLPGGPPMGGGGPPGLPPQVMPDAMMGVPPPSPVPQAGPVVPPGMPRPGAQGGPI